MNKRIWLVLIASTMLVTGLPAHAVAQMDGLEPRKLGPAPPFAHIQELVYGRRPDLAAAAAAKAAAGHTAMAQATATIPEATEAGTFTTFDAPGAGTGSHQGTRAFAINPAGAITGYY